VHGDDQVSGVCSSGVLIAQRFHSVSRQSRLDVLKEVIVLIISLRVSCLHEVSNCLPFECSVCMIEVSLS
jgi:hypothetical protein